MENKRFLKDVSASTVQIGVTQIANLVIFYLISKYISKEDFGFYNWSVALCTTLITILSFGMDLVYVKRVASGYKEMITINLHFFHTLVSGMILICLLGVFLLFFPSFLDGKMLFLLILINQVSFAVSNSIKLALNGLEKYSYLAYIAIVINIIKLIFILVLFFVGSFSISNIIYSFILTYLIEFIYCFFIARKILQQPIKPVIIASEYKELIKESLPQLGTIILSTSSFRVDLILMGILATTIKTAEYGFALKILQISQLPLMIISPIILTRFSKIFNNRDGIDIETSSKLDRFLKIEMIIAVLIPLGIVSIWTDFFDLITDNKYGAVNALTFQIMAVGIPLHYATNFLWTMAFSQGQLKQILKITIITFSMNAIGNVVLIHFFGGEGAALSDLLCSVISFILYYKITIQTSYKFKLKIPLIAITNGSIAVLISLNCDVHIILRFLITFVIYGILSHLTKQFDFKSLLTTNKL